MLTLRWMEKWRRNVSDYDSAMILVAVVAIAAERLTRADLPDELRDLSRPLPRDELARCNVRSIAAATRLNRETARRKVGALIEAGLLSKGDDGAIGFPPGHLQQDYIRELVRAQLDAVVRLTNDLCRDGTLSAQASAHRRTVEPHLRALAQDRSSPSGSPSAGCSLT